MYLLNTTWVAQNKQKYILYKYILGDQSTEYHCKCKGTKIQSR